MKFGEARDYCQGGQKYRILRYFLSLLGAILKKSFALVLSFKRKVSNKLFVRHFVCF